jgi:large subunit ribosomal protein L16
MAHAFTMEEYLSTLERVGWRAALPASGQRKLKASVREEFRVRPDAERLTPVDLFRRLAVVVVDLEMIDGTGPRERCSYHGLLRELARSSFGLFAPREIRDELDVVRGKARVSFQLANRAFRVELPLLGGWVHPAVFDKLVNRALRAVGTKHQFQALPAVDQCAQLAFVPNAVWRKASAAGLVPTQADVDCAGEAEAAARLPDPTVGVSGGFGLRALESGRVEALHVEAARQAIVKGVGRARLWIRVSPGLRVAVGNVLFELGGVEEATARDALRRGATELPIACEVFSVEALT